MLAQVLLKYERNEVFDSIYDKDPNEGRTAVTSHAVAVFRTL
jgi:hypothetical protein